MNNKIYTIHGGLYSYEKVSTKASLTTSDATTFTFLVENINTKESHQMVFVIAKKYFAKIEKKHGSKENAALYYLRDALNTDRFYEGFKETISE